MIRLLVLAGLLEGLGVLSPVAQTLAVVGLLGLLAGILFAGSERPLERLVKLVAAFRTPHQRSRHRRD